MSFTIVRTIEAQVAFGEANTASFNVTAGNSLVAGVVWAHPTDATITISSIVCGAQSFTLVGSPVRATYAGAENAMQFAYLGNVASSGSVTVHLTMSNTSSSSLDGTILVLEIAGADTTTTIEAANTGTGTGTSPSVTVNTVSANALLIGMCGCSLSAGGEPTPGTGFSAVEMLNIYGYNRMEYLTSLDAGAAGAKSVNFTLGGSAAWLMAAVAVKLSGAGGGTVKEQVIKLVDESGNPLANLTGLKVYGWDTNVPGNVATQLPADYTALGSTDASGFLHFTRTNTTLAVGNVGFMLVTQSDGSTGQSPAPRSWFAPAQITAA